MAIRGEQKETYPRPATSKYLPFMLVPVLFFILLFCFMVFSEWGQRIRALHAVDSSHLRQIGVAMYAYAEDNDGIFPSRPQLIGRYLSEPQDQRYSEFFNPFQKERSPEEAIRTSGPVVRFLGYVYVDLGFVINEVANPGQRILAYTAKVSSEQKVRNVLFADGHTERWDEQRLRDALPPEVDVDALDGPLD